jgi:hypothetical protein
VTLAAVRDNDWLPSQYPERAERINDDYAAGKRFCVIQYLGSRFCAICLTLIAFNKYEYHSMLGLPS